MAAGHYPNTLPRARRNQALGGEHFYRFPGNATADIELLRQLSLRWEGLVYRILALDYCRPQLMGQLVCKVTPCIQHNYLAYLYYIFALYPASAFLSVLLGQKQ